MNRISFRRGMTLRIMTVLVLATVLVLSGCIMNPSDDSDSSSGVVTINIPLTGSSVGGSDLGASAITANTGVRVWMYTPEGNEYRLASTGTGIPNARNYVQAAGGGSIVIDNIPAGDGYGLVAVVDNDITNSGGVFVPDRYAFEGSFSVAAGRETEVVLDLATPEETEGVGLFGTTLSGIDLNSVVMVHEPSPNKNVFAASSKTVYQNPFDEVFTLNSGEINISTFAAAPGTASSINSLSPVSADAFEDVFLVNTDIGTFPMVPGDPTYQPGKKFVDTGYSVGVRNVTGSGIFKVDASTAIAYYERLGGLGGVEVAVAGGVVDTSAMVSDDWNDTGDDLSEIVADDESPVWASASSNSAAYISSVLGTFRATEELFNSDDIDIDALLGGNSSAGLTFFSVAYPGTSRPLRIRQIGVSPNGGNVIVGTGRGAFYFPESSIDGVNGGFVSGVTGIPRTDGQYIVDMSVRDGFVALLTPSRLIVAKPGSSAPPREIPLRAVTLGLPRDIFIADTGSGAVTVYIAGSEGLSQVVFTAP